MIILPFPLGEGGRRPDEGRGQGNCEGQTLISQLTLIASPKREAKGSRKGFEKMCLAIPLKVVAVDGSRLKVESAGLVREVRADFLPGVQEGDFVIVHAGFAIEKLDAEQARLDLEAWEEVADALA